MINTEKCFKYTVLKYFHSIFETLNTVIQVAGILDTIYKVKEILDLIYKDHEFFFSDLQ